MSTKKHHKKKKHSAPQRGAEGRCSCCGEPLTLYTALIVREKWYCMKSRCRPAELALPPAAASFSSDGAKKESGIFSSAMTIRLLVTIVLCLIVFVAVALRERERMKSEIAVLRESRLALIDLFKTRNREAENSREPKTDTASLDSAALPEKTGEISSPPEKNTRRSVVKRPVRQYRPAPEIPFSVANGVVDRKKVALTFDGGSLANVAGEILDTLASRSVKATMFLTGFFIRKHPDIVRRIIAEGHECGNHTWSHPHLTTYAENSIHSTLPDITQPLLASQFSKAAKLFHEVTGSTMVPLWRAPYGEFNGELCRWGYQAGYVHLAWRQGRTWLDGLDSNDWVPDSTVPGYRTPEEFLDKITRIASLPPPGINGGIILLHLGTQRKDPALRTHRVLGAVIDTLRGKGFTIVPASEMVNDKGFDLASLQGRSDIQ